MTCQCIQKTSEGETSQSLLSTYYSYYSKGIMKKVIDRVESLNLYCYRYLRKDDTYRSNCFIKMLLQLPKANFHREAVVRKTEKLYNKLIENPSNLSMQASEIEIMPYEMLWEYVLDSLDNKIHPTRSV